MEKDFLDDPRLPPKALSAAVFVVLLIFIFIWYSTSITSPASSNPTAFYTIDLVNVRACGSVNCKIIGQYPENTKFDLNNTKGNLPDWVQVGWTDSEGNLKQGYVSKSVLTDQSLLNTSQPPSAVQSPVLIQSPSESTDLPSIVKEWSPRVVRIVCSDENFISTGSGVLTRMDWSNQGGLSDSATLISNKHVVTDPVTNQSFTACNFAVPQLSQVFNLTMQNERILTNQDVAFFPSEKDNPPPGAQSAMKVCDPNSVDVGDKVIILGYPTNGGTGTASTAITATDGIISSYDGEFYVTDAKIDHGNSGGAAILLKNDCYLGIPSWVSSGGFESLGRILSARYFLQQ